MSMGFIKDGKYVQVAGNPPPSGELVTGASTIRTGTFTSSQGTTIGSVTFDSPMPDADYIVECWSPSYKLEVDITTKTKNGFSYIQKNLGDGSESTQTYTYTAFKLYTVEGLEELEADVEELEADVDTLKSSVSAIGKYGYSGIKTVEITGGSTSAIQIDTTVKLSAGKTYLLGLHASQNPTDGACTVMITDASGTGISYWENSLICPIGKCKLGQSFPVKLAADTTLGIKVTPWQASAGNWTMSVEISWTQLS